MDKAILSSVGLKVAALKPDVLQAVFQGLSASHDRPHLKPAELCLHALQALKHNPELKAHPWMDLGTGSGAIALGLATLLPASSPILAVDASPDAAPWAQLNIQRLQCQEQVQARQQSLHLLLAPQLLLLREVVNLR